MMMTADIDLDTVRERIIRKLGEGKTERLTGIYEAAYRGTSLTAEEVWEEVVCDSLGDMNIFSGTIHEEAAGELLKPTKEAAGAERETVKTRGPPEMENAAREGGGGKASIEMLPGGERIG